MPFQDCFHIETAALSSLGNSAAWQPLGSLKSIQIRVGKESAPRLVAAAQAIAGEGLAGDRHAAPLSPRQLLVAGSAAYARWGLPPAALRENLLFDFATERLGSGDLVRIGEEVILWMTFLCEACGRLERRCPGTLKTIGADRGILARVLRGGVLRQGDPIALCSVRAPEFSPAWQERVLQVARAVPENAWISYRQLAQMAGVQTAYCRAFPRVLSRLPAAVAGRVRAGAERLGAPPWSGAGSFDIGSVQ